MVAEQRVRELEQRMDVLVERLDGVEAAVAGGPRAQAGFAEPARVEAPEAVGYTPPSRSPSPSPVRPASPADSPPDTPEPRLALPRLRRARRRPSLDDVFAGRTLEDILGGSVLAWVGGLAVLIGVAFLFAVGVSRGWIGEGARVLFAGAGSAGLLALGVWLHERRGRTEAALAAVATGISALFVTLTVGTEVYGVLPGPIALGLALAVGAVATSVAVRWEAQGIAGLGILGALVAPWLAGAPADGGTMAILLIAAASAVGVLVHQRWGWLSFAVFVVTVPQWIVYLFEDPPTYAVIAVLVGFGLVGAAAAVGYELRTRAETIRPSSAFLLSLNAIAVAAAGWLSLTGLGDGTLAKLWLVAAAAAHLGIGLWTTQARLASHDFGLLALVIGAVLADVAFAGFVDGPARAIGWAGAGVMLAALTRFARLPGRDEALAALGLGAHVALALLQSVTSDAPVQLLGEGGALGFGAAISLAGVAAGCIVSARLADGGLRELRIALEVAGLGLAAYLTALTLDGALLTLALSLEAVALARLGSRARDEVAAWAGRGYLFFAAIHAVAVVAPFSAVADGVPALLPVVVALGALALAAAACAWFTARDAPRIRAALEAVAMGGLAYLACVTLDGAALVVVLAGGAVALAELARRSAAADIAAAGALAYLGGALAHVLLFEAPPSALVAGVGEWTAAAAGLGAIVLAALVCVRPGARTVEHRNELLGAAALMALYLASVLVVTPFQPGNPGAEGSFFDLDVRQQGQVLLSALWCVAGVGALVLGLRRDLRVVRLGALALLLVTVAKVFMFDLATLTSIYRVASFIGLGLFLLTAAFVWQRMRPRPLPDMREVPEGVR